MERGKLLVCNDDFPLLDYDTEEGSAKSVIENSRYFREGIYRCYTEFSRSYSDFKQLYSNLRHLFTEYLRDPSNSMPCAVFTSEDSKTRDVLSEACRIMRTYSQMSMPDGDQQLRIEHIVLAYIIKMLRERDGHSELPVIDICPLGKSPC